MSSFFLFFDGTVENKIKNGQTRFFYHFLSRAYKY